MKTSTPAGVKPVTKKSICLIGAPGSGKTALCMQFPNVWFADCDENLDGPEFFVRKKNAQLAYSYDNIRRNDDNEPIEIYKCFDRLIDKLGAIGKEPSIETVVVDSLTYINEFIIQKVLKAQQREVMEARDWQPFESYAIALLVGKLRSFNKTTIVTVHEIEKTKNDPKVVMKETVESYVPSFQSKVGDSLGGFFTDVWRCSAEPAVGGGVEYKVTTNRTTKSAELKNSMGMPDEFKCKTGELMYDKIKPYLK